MTPTDLRITPDLGVTATVVMDQHTHGPRTLGDGDNSLRRCDFEDTLVSDLDIVSHWTLWVALYALQRPTFENVARAMSLIGTSGDVDDWLNGDTLLPLEVPEPPGWSE